jgi:ribosome-associated toxin RatA of RatAB toxin-antitoxin module
VQRGSWIILLIALVASATPHGAHTQAQSPALPSATAGNWVLNEVLTSEDIRRMASGGVVTRRLDTPAGYTGAHLVAAATIPTTANEIFETLSDCESFHIFLPHLEECLNIYPEGVDPESVRSFDQRQRVRISVAFLRWDLTFTHQVLIQPPYLISWELKDGDLAQSLGYWRVFALADDEHILVYRVLVDPGTGIPMRLQEALMRRDLPRMVQAMKDEILSRRVKRAVANGRRDEVRAN